MKHLLANGVWALGILASAAAFTACSSDDDFLGNQGADGASGSFAPMVSVDRSVVSSRAAARDDIDLGITADDLSLTLSGGQPGFVPQTWNSIADFDPSLTWPIGNYTLEAFYGTAADEGFEKPYFYGKADFTIAADTSTPVSFSVALANSMATVTYTDAFKSYFSSYSAQLHTEGGAYHTYAAGESRPLFVKPGEVQLFVDVTKPNGTSARLNPASFTAKAQHLHNVTIDVNEGKVGSAELVITFDETLAEEPVTIDLTDDLMSAAAPQVTPRGFTPGTPVSLCEQVPSAAELGWDIIAMGGLKQVILTTSSTSLLAKGWPAEVDLANPGADLATMTALGLKLRGLGTSTVSKMATIDLADVVEYIEYVDDDSNSVTFTLLVKDKMTKVSESQTLALSITPNPYRMTMKEYDVWATKALANVSVPDGETPNLFLKSGSGSYAAVTPTYEGDKAVISGLTPGTAYTLKLSETTSASGRGTEISFTTEAAAGVPNGDFENLTETLNISGQLQGGKFKRTKIATVSGQNKQSFTLNEPNGWASSNSLTYNTSASADNSWFRVLSVYPGNINFMSTVATVAGMGGQTSTPGIYQAAAKSGNVAMVLRNVAYAYTGSVPSTYSWTAAGTDSYYNPTVPTITNRMAGKLKLSNAAFASRPSALNGYYKYVCDSQDTSENGTVQITLYSGSTAIATGSAALTAVADYKQFSAPLTYSRTDLKADKLTIALSSSNRADAAVKTTSRAELFLQESTGAVLTVDNLTFAY